MPPPTPPVALRDHCSIIHDDVLYVYSPDAFQTLPLKNGTRWTQEQNGVSVKGATCVKGGVDGDNNKTALYVVGGAANSSSLDYPGLQRYSIADKTWETITPVVPVTQNRQYHAAGYMNASSSIVVYGGSQNGDTGASSQTFLVMLYPPYGVQAYSSIAPTVVEPYIFPWSKDAIVMVGGSPTNKEVWTFDPGNGWQDLGTALPSALPNSKGAQCALLTLDDNSKVLQTFRLDQSPNTVTRNVLLNSDGLPAAYNQTVGNPTSSAISSSTRTRSRVVKRSISLNDFPAYDGESAPTTIRSGASLAQGDDGLITIVGGDSSDSIAIYNGTGNGWINATSLLGSQAQTPISSAPTQSASNTSPTSTSSPATTNSGGNNKHGLTILGAVLGAICGVAAILIILLLWLRNVRRRRAQAKNNSNSSGYTEDKGRSQDYNAADSSLHPFSRAGQAMGRSPVPSAVLTNHDAATPPADADAEKELERQLSATNTNGLKLNPHNSSVFGHNLFKKEKPPLAISKPMLPDLGTYKERPSIELGRATPAAAIPVGLAARNVSQRSKPGEGWSQYFSDNGTSYPSQSSLATPTARSKSGFWPGAGVPETPQKSPRVVLRDSAGNALDAQTVAVGSPSLENGAVSSRPHEGVPGHISSADSVSTDHSDDDDDYEDDQVGTVFSSGIPEGTHERIWTPVGNTWSGPAERPLRPLSTRVGIDDFPLPTSGSNKTGDTSGTGSSSIPSFPMPNSTIRRVAESRQVSNESALTGVPTVPHYAPMHFAVTTRGGPAPPRPSCGTEDTLDYYGGDGLGRDGTPNPSDMSWLNLGTSH